MLRLFLCLISVDCRVMASWRYSRGVGGCFLLLRKRFIAACSVWDVFGSFAWLAGACAVWVCPFLGGYGQYVLISVMIFEFFSGLVLMLMDTSVPSSVGSFLSRWIAPPHVGRARIICPPTLCWSVPGTSGSGSE